jgi:nitrate reductase delta subunit
MTHFYETLADLLEYPGDNWRAALERCREQVTTEHSALASLLEEFHQSIEALTLAELQEKYTQTFDLNPVCTLEIGYHLFGENYKRGVFLANLRETEAPFDLGQQQQLPDYLPVLLRLLVKLPDMELREALISECMLPALDRMLAALTENLYGALLRIVQETLKIETPNYEPRAATAAFSMAGDANAPPELYRISSRHDRRQRSEQL